MNLKRALSIYFFFFVSVNLFATNLQQRIQTQHNQQVIEEDNEEIILPGWGVKTNFLYSAAATFNFGAEFRTGRTTSIDLPIMYNPWTFSNNKKWKHILIQPELRWWPHGTFRGYFFGLHAHYAFYNVGGLDHPPFSKYMNEHRFEGWLAGIGLSHGYRWNINHRWGLEASLGMGYAYLSYDRCLSLRCSEKSGSDTKHYITPTKAGITLIYSFGGKRKASEPFPAYPPKSNKHAIINESKSTVSDIVPKVETVKTRNETAKIYLAFVMGRSEIVSGFKNNADGLQRIQNLIHQLLDDPNATITGISIVGYASIEGNYIDNLTLSQQRAVALKDYIKSLYGIRDNHIFTIWGAGEDWATLEELVSRSNMSEKYRILDIIRNTDIFAGREKKLMDLAGGNPYRQMRDEMFPLLRRVECQIHYTVSNGIDATNHK